MWRGTFFETRWHVPTGHEAVSVGPFLEIAMPTGRVNQESELILAPRIGAEAAYMISDRVTVGVGLSWRRNLHPTSRPTFDPGDSTTDDITGNGQMVFVGAGESVSRITDVVRPSGGKVGPAMMRPETTDLVGYTRDITSLETGVTVHVLEPLAVSLAYAYHRFNGYKTSNVERFTPDDQPVIADTEAPPVLHLHSGTLDVVYSADEWVQIGGGLSTSQPTKGPNSDASEPVVTFPFWNTRDAWANRSKVRLYVVYRY